jgi:hypothetical protein
VKSLIGFLIYSRKSSQIKGHSNIRTTLTAGKENIKPIHEEKEGLKELKRSKNTSGGKKVFGYLESAIQMRLYVTETRDPNAPVR